MSLFLLFIHHISGTSIQRVRFSANWCTVFLLVSSLTLQWITQSFPSFYILVQILYLLVITWDLLFLSLCRLDASKAFWFIPACFFGDQKNSLWLRKDKVFQSSQQVAKIQWQMLKIKYALEYFKCLTSEFQRSVTVVHGHCSVT